MHSRGRKGGGGEGGCGMLTRADIYHNHKDTSLSGGHICLTCHKGVEHKEQSFKCF